MLSHLSNKNNIVSPVFSQAWHEAKVVLRSRQRHTKKCCLPSLGVLACLRFRFRQRKSWFSVSSQHILMPVLLPGSFCVSLTIKNFLLYQNCYKETSILCVIIYSTTKQTQPWYCMGCVFLLMGFPKIIRTSHHAWLQYPIVLTRGGHMPASSMSVYYKLRKTVLVWDILYKHLGRILNPTSSYHWLHGYLVKHKVDMPLTQLALFNKWLYTHSLKYCIIPHLSFLFVFLLVEHLNYLQPALRRTSGCGT